MSGDLRLKLESTVSLRLKLEPAPRLLCNVKPFFPGTVVGGGGIIVSQAGTVFTISADMALIISSAAAAVGSGFQPSDPDLTAIAGLGTTGMLTRTAANTWALRTITGTAGITATNGDGVAGNPAISLDTSSARNKLHPSSTDNAIARYDGTAGDLQNSVVTIADVGTDNVAAVAGSRINDASTVIGSPGAFWSPTFFGNNGTGVVHRFNRMFVGGAVLASSDGVSGPPGTTTPDWLESIIPNTTSRAQLSATSALGMLGVVGGARSSDFRTWAGGATGGAQGISGFGYNDDTTGDPIATGLFGMAVRASGVGGTTENELTVANGGSVVDITPFSSLGSGGQTVGLNITAGIAGFTNNITAALTFDQSITAVFRKGLVVFSDALDTSVGSGGGGVAIELARNQGIRWLNSGGTTDTEIWGRATGLTINSSLVLGASITTGEGVSTGDASIELGGNRSGSGNAYIDFHATSGSDYECRFLRLGGTNGGASFSNTGTGDFSFTQEGAGALSFKISNTERFRIDTSGMPIWNPSSATPATLGTNGQITMTLISNTQLRFTARGSDGTTRGITHTIS